MGKRAAHVFQRTGTDKTRYVLQRAEIKIAAGLHDHERQAAQGGFEGDRRGVGGPDDGSGKELCRNGAVGKVQALRCVAEQLAQQIVHRQIGVRLDDDFKIVQQTFLQTARQKFGMRASFVGKEACHSQQPGMRRSLIRNGHLLQVEIAQSFDFSQAFGGHTRVLPLGMGALPVGQNAIRLKVARRLRLEGSRIVKIAEVRGPDGGVLRAVNRAAVRKRVHGMREHAFPRAVFQREGIPALGADAANIVGDAALLEAAFKAAPAFKAFLPVRSHVLPEDHVRTREAECAAQSFFQLAGCLRNAAVPLPRREQIPRRKKFFHIIEGDAILAGSAEGVAPAQALVKISLGRGKTDKEPANAGCSLFRQSVMSFATMAMNWNARIYGDAAVAALAIVNKVFNFIQSIVIGFGQGFQPVLGYNYGAKKLDRVKEALVFSLRTCTIILAVGAVLGFLFAPQIVTFFRRDDLVIEIGTRAFRYQCFTLALSGVLSFSNMLFQSLGKSFRATILAICRQGAYIPLVFFLSSQFGLTGLELTQVTADFVAFVTSTIIMVHYFTKEFGRENDR